MRTNSPTSKIVAWLLLYALALFALITLTILTFHSGFGIGAAMALCLPSLTVPVLGVLILREIRHHRRASDLRTSRVPILLAAPAIALMLTSPAWGSFLATKYCDSENKRLGNEIVQAVERFSLGTGQLPTTSDDLIPKYMPNWPKPVCACISRINYMGHREPAFTYSPNEQGFFLTVDTPLVVFVQSYNSRTNTWSEVDRLP